MLRTPTIANDPLDQAQTRTTAELVDARLHDVLIVDGPFGWSGAYPLDLPETRQGDLCVRHCSLYYLRFAMSTHVRDKVGVVVERTHYRLADGDVMVVDEDLCTRCLNRACPPNRNPTASVQDLPPGKLTLQL